ncbi:DUF6340 family protein [Maribacter sp. ACAM166]|uniref:DUF6340 family protein n=1 Tax=Maribacter sp. ACAM166 TaxID=2508996 RepID=UPI0010FE8171|nr:DUF6340 family protein [Maribacter sp. ACAM166]TLP79601.1 hypothetical protein ES765_10150 [Maribacter sp. ACAM166]
MKNFVFIVLLASLSFLFIACSSTNRLTMVITQPAQVSIASDVAHVGIINRSVVSEKNKIVDKIDKVLSLEGLHLDKEGAQQAISGLQYELERGKRFDTVKIIESQQDFEKGLGVFPAALSWDIVDQICKEHGVDVLFSLEFYDTDTAAGYEMTMVRIPNNLGIVAEVPGHKIKLNTVIKNGWRIYDPADRTIVDEYISNDHVFSKGEGINPLKALEAIIGRKEAVFSISANLGANYALYTKPERIRIARDYFVRGSANFKIAKRRALVGNWDGAAELWNSELNNPKLKVAGRAYYNMAISNEINGNLNQAIEFASKAYADYGNKEGLPYVNMLKTRVVNQQELNRQLAK